MMKASIELCDGLSIEDDWVSSLSFVLHRVILPSWSKNLLTWFHDSGDEEKNVYCYVAFFYKY